MFDMLRSLSVFYSAIESDPAMLRDANFLAGYLLPAPDE